MQSPTSHVRDCIQLASSHAEALAIALVRRRDDEALADAATVDPSLPMAGDVLTVKACFDVAGWTTHAGSAVLADAPAGPVGRTDGRRLAFGRVRSCWPRPT